MNKIKVFTDSTNDLNTDILEKHKISVVPLGINFNDKTYKDGVDIDYKLLYKKVEELNCLPKTSAPAPLDFYNSFKPYVEKGYDIIYIGLSSQISTTIQNSILASNELQGNIRIIDSLNLSTGVGLLSLIVCDLIEEGLSLDEIEDQINLDYRKRINTSFVVDTLDYLHKGGRCSALKSLVGNTFKIKPVIEVDQGSLHVKKRIRGKKTKIVKIMRNEIINNSRNIDKKRFFITHSMCDDLVYDLRDDLLKNTDLEEIFITETGSIISSHCGPGTLGLVYLES